MKLDYGPPDRELLSELKEVKASAGAVVVALNQANAIPEDFPREVLEDLCDALSGLEAGTAENCSVTLEYARNKIPEIRREYFHLEDDIFTSEGLPIEEPRLYRGMPLDFYLSALISSVTTALDEYRAQAQKRFDDEVRAEEVVVLPAARELAASADATCVIEASNQAIVEITSNNVHNTARGDVLTRRLMDSKNLATAARSQFRSRKIVRRWFEGIAQAFRELPELISRAGRAIKVGTDVADILSDWWSTTEHVILRTVINQIREFGGALEEISTALRRQPIIGAETPINVESEVATERINAEAEVARLMKSGREVPTELGELVQQLSVYGEAEEIINIYRWKDVSRCRNIRSLRAQNTNFSILRHGELLNALYSLQSLVLSNQDQSDIDAVENIASVATLSLQTNATDISSMTNMQNLLSLKLKADETEDISAVGTLLQLESLSLSANRVKNIRPLRHLTKLQLLILVGNGLKDLSPLEALSQITSLSISGTNVIDLGPISALRNLGSLKVQSFRLRELDPLSTLTNLTSLSVQANEVLDISPLESLKHLVKLSLDVSSAQNINSLRQFANLTSLSLLTNVADDLSALGKLKRLSSLSLTANKVEDLSALKGLEFLSSLSLQAHSITDISFLGSLRRLKALSLQGNNQELGFEALSCLLELVRLDLTGFNWEWFEHVGRLPSLERLSLTGGGSVDLAPLAKLANLRTVRVNSVQVLNAHMLRGVDIKHSFPRPIRRA